MSGEEGGKKKTQLLHISQLRQRTELAQLCYVISRRFCGETGKLRRKNIISFGLAGKAPPLCSAKYHESGHEKMQT